MAVSREPEFRTTRMREGYDLDAVDDFVDLVIDALEGRSAGRGVTPEQIEGEEFKVVRMREGYVMDDVDDWLDAAAAELRRIRKAASGSGPPATAPAQTQTQAPAQDFSTQHAAVNAHHGPAGAQLGAPSASPVSHPGVSPAPPQVAPPAVVPPGSAYAGPGAPPASPSYPSYYDSDPGTAATSYGPAHGNTSPGATSPGATSHGAPGLGATSHGSTGPNAVSPYGPAQTSHASTGPNAVSPYGPAQTSHASTGPNAVSSYASPQTSPGMPPGYDPLTDSAVNELDPVLRALDPSFAAADQQYPSQSPPAQSPIGEPTVDEQSLSPSTTPSTGLHHVEVWVRDLDAATRSFGWLFERLGWTLFQAWEHGRSWQAPGGGPYVVVEASPDMSWVAYDRKAPGLNHLALAVPEQWMVDRIVSEAPAYGWRLMFADRHPHAGGPHHYAAYMENDEGYEVEVVAP